MNKKIILDYDEYLKMIEKIEVMIELLSYSYFCKVDKLEELKKRIEVENKRYGWWV